MKAITTGALAIVLALGAAGCGGARGPDPKALEADHADAQQALDRAERNEEVKQDRERED